jgi:hypothetical protein
MNSKHADKNWADLTLTDFMDFDVVRHEGKAFVIIDYISYFDVVDTEDGDDVVEIEQPISLMGFSTSEDFSDFEVLEKGHEHYQDMMEKLRKNEDNV